MFELLKVNVLIGVGSKEMACTPRWENTGLKPLCLLTLMFALPNSILGIGANKSKVA